MVLPLFPLPIVLFPNALIPLHIFEPRYRALLADCVAADHRFGLVVAPGGEEPPAPGSVGAVARIRAVQPLPEGRSNIVVSGDGRFRLTRVVPSEKPYFVGEVEEFVDVPDIEVPAADALRTLRTLSGRYAAGVATIEDTEADSDLSDDPAALTFQVAALLEWDLETKQHFFGLRSPTERVALLLHTLPALVAGVESRAAVHRRAGHNGTGVRQA